MNLRAYFQKIREVEKEILKDVVYVVSLAGDDGGLPGIIAQVTRAIAAKLIVDQKSRLATDEEIETLLAYQEAERQKLQEQQAVQRLQVAIVSDKQIEAMRAKKSPAAPPAEKKKD
ncbi:hypothetical protein F183_A44000 [Bryobacterales bacterium F-183]|nr:hypothetical protein F183_A44000 [Bryobacterales bacterium F-183]